MVSAPPIPLPKLRACVPPVAVPPNMLIVCVFAEGLPLRILSVSFWAELPPLIVVVLAAAGAMFPKPIVVTLVLFPKANVPAPKVPIPERILTILSAADAPLAIEMV